MKKICIITAARSEYGALKWIINAFRKSKNLDMQLVVTGGHLIKEQGYTLSEITNDGNEPDKVIDCKLAVNYKHEIANYMGRLAIEFADYFRECGPDAILVAGDRYELLPICNTALLMHIPIIHISGGDVTEGAIDNNIRNALSSMATYHFPGTKMSKKRLVSLLGTEENIWMVGEPTLDSFLQEKLYDRGDLAKQLGLDIDKKWCLFTYHAETKSSLANDLLIVENCIKSLVKNEQVQIIATFSNLDFGGDKINNRLISLADSYENKVFVVPSLGHIRYLSMLKEVAAVVGNSSSGIIETPFFGVPTINIGNRQKGRYLCKNIIQCDEIKDIEDCIDRVVSMDTTQREDCFYWGNGHASDEIVSILEKIMNG